VLRGVVLRCVALRSRMPCCVVFMCAALCRYAPHDVAVLRTIVRCIMMWHVVMRCVVLCNGGVARVVVCYYMLGCGIL